MPAPRIFISYRREDTSGYAGRLYDDVRDHFGREQLVVDIDSIEPGVDFVEFIQDAVGTCDVLIALIGKRWLSVRDSKKHRRLDNPNDFVRLEIAAALQRDIRVIPVLVQGAHMPAAERLPDDLRGLAVRQALEIADARWQDDVGRLIRVLEGLLGPGTDGIGRTYAQPVGLSAPVVDRDAAVVDRDAAVVDRDAAVVDRDAAVASVGAAAIDTNGQVPVRRDAAAVHGESMSLLSSPREARAPHDGTPNQAARLRGDGSEPTRRVVWPLVAGATALLAFLLIAWYAAGDPTPTSPAASPAWAKPTTAPAVPANPTEAARPSYRK